VQNKFIIEKVIKNKERNEYKYVQNRKDDNIKSFKLELMIREAKSHMNI